MNETISLLGLIVSIIIVIGSTLYGVYKITNGLENRINENNNVLHSKIENMSKEINELKLSNIKNQVEQKEIFGVKINCIETKQTIMEKDITSFNEKYVNLFKEISEIKSTITDLYNKINNLTSKIMELIEKK